MDKTIITQLQKIVGSGQISTSREERLCYSYDSTGREFLPEAVVFPGSTEEISRIMQLAFRERFSVVPRGAGSGATGGALPTAGGLVMALSRLNRIIEIDPDNMIAVAEPGVITADLQKAVRRLGLFYPPDPASRTFCSLGGNVAECAGGPSAVKYGVTRDYVLGLEAVLADGRIIHTGVRTAKGVVGYDLTRLLVGSEGTLAVITRMTLRLLAVPPEKSTFLLLFDAMAAATGFVASLLKQHTPCTLEYMDRTAIDLVREELPLQMPPETRALLLVELDGEKEMLAIQSDRLVTFLADTPGLLQTLTAAEEDHDTLWAARRKLSAASFKLRPHKINEDVVVPRNRIPELVGFTEKLARDLDIPIFTFGHAGDGNIHVNIMVDKTDTAELRKGETAKKLLFEQVLALGGTLSGEHGIGLTKSAYINMEIDPDTLKLMRQIKAVFDPHNILNPGKIFPDENSESGL